MLSEAQKKAGNYPKGHTHVLGMRASIETKAGEERSGTDHEGKEWKQTLQHDYGYLRGTMGRDKDHIDAFFGPEDPAEHPVHVVDQLDHESKFDEHKVMLGFKDADAASEAYHANYEPGWRGLGDITPMAHNDFKKWALAPGRRMKPVAEHSVAKGYADGGLVTNAGGAAFGNPNLTRQGRRAGALPERMSDYQDVHNPVTAALAGFMGTAPDELAGSVLDPNYQSNKAAAVLPYVLGTAAQLPILKGAQGAGRVTRGALEHLGESMAATRPAYVPNAQLGAIKLKGGNWLPGSLESVTDNLKGFRPEGKDPVGQWLDTQMSRYLKNDLGTATDPLLKLEAEGKLHISRQDMEAAIANWEPRFTSHRSDFHKAQTGRVTRTPWETMSDSRVATLGPRGALARLQADNNNAPEWLKNLPDTADVHRLIPGNFNELGFDHVRDYMDAATEAHNSHSMLGGDLGVLRARDPIASGMVERNLHIDPAKLQNMSVPDIVAKTAEWNKMLANQAAEDLSKGIKQVHKQYDNGNQWVELDHSGLKAEGAAMKHCVGGYCSQVEDGSARILSLRGKDGNPMATVEVTPQTSWFTSGSLKTNLNKAGLPPELYDAYVKFQEGLLAKNVYKNQDDALNQFAQIQGLTLTPVPQSIQQIKGPGNGKPSAEAMTHIQDLVKGQVPGFEQWSQVNDLQNSGLLKGGAGSTNIKGPDGQSYPASMLDTPYYTRKELADHFISQGVPIPLARQHAGDFEGLRAEGMAKGGAVQPTMLRLTDVLSPKELQRVKSTGHPVPEFVTPQESQALRAAFTKLQGYAAGGLVTPEQGNGMTQPAQSGGLSSGATPLQMQGMNGLQMGSLNGPTQSSIYNDPNQGQQGALSQTYRQGRTGTDGVDMMGRMVERGVEGQLVGAGLSAVGANGAVPYAGSIVSALNGDYRSAAWSAGGAAIGSIIPGVGTVIGSIVGSLLGSIFS